MKMPRVEEQPWAALLWLWTAIFLVTFWRAGEVLFGSRWCRLRRLKKTRACYLFSEERYQSIRRRKWEAKVKS